MSKKIIGIDLGTGASCVAVMENGQVKVIPNSEGMNTTPSVVGFANGERKIGDAARRQQIMNPKNTIYEVKRLMGHKLSEVTHEASRVTYDVVEDNKGRAAVKVNDKVYSPEEISAFILQKMKKTAEDYLGNEVTEAVITCPAYFNDEQRKSIIAAGKIAGLDVKRIINEPTAAALAYKLDVKSMEKDTKIAIFDSGSGTLDFTILEYSDGICEVLSTSGRTEGCAGSDVDECIIKWIVKEFKDENGVDISSDPMAMQRVRDAAEKAKCELSSTTSSEINLPYLFPVDNVPKHFVKTLTRSALENMISRIVNESMEACKECLDAANLSTSDIDEVVLVGGTTRIPAIQTAIENYFGKPANKSIDPMTCVAVGAAIMGATLNNEEGSSDILLLDVTPLDLRIEVAGGQTAVLVPANTTIPCKRNQQFANYADYQAEATIHVLQGNRPSPRDDKSLGQFNIEITKAPRGQAQIDVEFDIDANGVIKVTAKDVATGKEKDIRIEGNGTLSEDEIERMRAEAAKFEAQDKKFEEDGKKFNEYESRAYGVRDSLKEENFQKILTESQKTALTEKYEAVLKAVDARNLEDAERLTKEMTDIYEPIVKKLYESQQGAQQGQPGGFDFNEAFKQAQQQGHGQAQTQQPQNDSSDDVQDADFEEVK